MASDFTIVAIGTFPAPWPAPQRTQFFETTHKGATSQLWGHSDGHIEVVVIYSDGTPATQEHFQCVVPPVAVTKTRFDISSANGNLRFSLNGVDLQPLATSAGQSFLLPANIPQASESSIGHPAAVSACALWIAKRQQRFSARKPFVPKREHRLKTFPEQVRELRAASRSLHDLLEAVFHGARHQIPLVAASLRALLYWPNLNATWNPLLLRLANVANLPLPIFAFSDAVQPPGGPSVHMRNLSPAIIREESTQELMDIEAYLRLEILTVTGPATTTRLTAEEALAAAANSHGASHYDETVVLEIERLGEVVFAQTTALDTLLVGLGRAAVGLAEFVSVILSGPSSNA